VVIGWLYVSSAPTATLDPDIGGDKMGSSISLFLFLPYRSWIRISVATKWELHFFVSVFAV
jgi:hypothetical protein